MTAAAPRQEKVAVQAQEKVAVPRQEAAGGQGQETAAAPKQEATLVAEVATLSAAARVVKEAALVGHSTRRRCSGRTPRSPRCKSRRSWQRRPT